MLDEFLLIHPNLEYLHLQFLDGLDYLPLIADHSDMKLPKLRVLVYQHYILNQGSISFYHILLVAFLYKQIIIFISRVSLQELLKRLFIFAQTLKFFTWAIATRTTMMQLHWTLVSCPLPAFRNLLLCTFMAKSFS